MTLQFVTYCRNSADLAKRKHNSRKWLVAFAISHENNCHNIIEYLPALDVKLVISKWPIILSSLKDPHIAVQRENYSSFE